MKRKMKKTNLAMGKIKMPTVAGYVYRGTDDRGGKVGLLHLKKPDLWVRSRGIANEIVTPSTAKETLAELEIEECDGEFVRIDKNLAAALNGENVVTRAMSDTLSTYHLSMDKESSRLWAATQEVYIMFFYSQAEKVPNEKEV